MKCPKCGAECAAGVKFCEECGGMIPQQKECPQCHTMLSPTTKFCGECGYSFVAPKAPATAPGGNAPKGMNIGDKNVIAGDVIGSQDAYNISGGATFVTNTDETKKMVQCHVCGRNILIGDSSNCPICHEVTCHDCLDQEANMCKSCAEEKLQGIENHFLQLLKEAYKDGRITLEEREQLAQKRQIFGISERRAFELENSVKAELGIAAKGASKAEPTLFEQTICHKAFEAFYEEENGEKALSLLEPLYKKYPLNEKILSLYAIILYKQNPKAAQYLIDSVEADVQGLYLAAIDMALEHDDLGKADEKLTVAEGLWPNDFLIACRRVFCLIKMSQSLGVSDFLGNANEKLCSLPPPSNTLENSWLFKAQSALSIAMGDSPQRVTRQFCLENNLYYVVVGDDQEASADDEADDEAEELTEEVETELPTDNVAQKSPAQPVQAGNLKRTGSFEFMVELFTDYAKKNKNIFVKPNIPEKKLRNALASYAPMLVPNEVEVLVDATIFGSAKEGVLITKDAIYYKKDKPQSIRVTDATTLCIGKNGYPEIVSGNDRLAFPPFEGLMFGHGLHESLTGFFLGKEAMNCEVVLTRSPQDKKFKLVTTFAMELFLYGMTNGNEVVSGVLNGKPQVLTPRTFEWVGKQCQSVFASEVGAIVELNLK